ncbi:phosphohydrolase [Staphylococcus felis]|uniref:metallophosphoesterase family protein n=1 Tax=Staphylococcus felis TaxID=46127 RepID=UPI000E28B4AF|nr:metallophosphoesterase family protein [Staphylococcus felis]REH88129.1 phosphohydrolase [Staphylococcus felis]
MSSFKIMQLTDLHLGPNHDEKDQQTYQLLEQLITTYQPDLCLLTGDQIWSQGVLDSDRVYRELFQFLNQFNTTIATTFGNHDTENQFRRSDLRAIEKEVATHYVDKKHTKIIDDKEAYVIEIYQNQNLTHLIYVIDGGDYSESAIGDYAYIHPGHVAWIEEVESSYRQKGIALPGHNVLFTHIPIPEYQAIEHVQNFHGIYQETIGCAQVNSGLFAQMLHTGGIEAMFCGHDHDNDFGINHYGIDLNYGRVSGFNCYGEIQRGARLIELIPNQPYRTKIVEYDQRF